MKTAPAKVEAKVKERKLAAQKKPRAPRKRKIVAPASLPADLPALVTWLETVCDKSRLEKVTAMLKTTRHQLFCDATPDRLIGIIRSQRSTQLFYACQIGSDGVFGCCDPELNPCMGQLKNKPCKHLLVLMLALMNAKKISIQQVVDWICNIQTKPKVDEMLMAETLIKYKDAESGTVDWRPVESIPEDYYAL
jgi:hypothetical protein